MAAASSGSPESPVREEIIDSREVVGSDVDLFGPQKVIRFENPSLGAQAILVTHNIQRGPAIGGVRMAADVAPREVYELARAMTWKNAAALIPHGGAKSSIVADPAKFPHGSAERRALIEWFADCVRSHEEYIPGPDMNTDERDMEILFERNGRAIGRKEIIPLDELGLTALGVMHSLRILVREGFVPGLKEHHGASLAVEGFGNVGSALARLAEESEMALVAASDFPDPARDYGGVAYHPDGLDVSKLLALREEGRSVIDTDQKGVQVFRGRAELTKVFGFPADVLVPAARTNSVHMDEVNTIQAKVVLEAANAPLTPAAEEYLHQKGVPVGTDYLVNCGGVIGGAEEYAELKHPLGSLRIPRCVSRITDAVAMNLPPIFSLARERGISPREAAAEIVQPRIK